MYVVLYAQFTMYVVLYAQVYNVCSTVCSGLQCM